MALSKTSSILAIVPARGGSKEVPRKNIRDFAGKPLICHTIDAARLAQTPIRLIVSTDDAEIASVAEAAGAEVPFLRSAELARDETPTFPVVEDALERLRVGGYAPELVMILQATSPLRTPADIDAALALLHESAAESLISVTRVTQQPYWMKELDTRARVKPFIETSEALRRQDLPTLYIANGAIYISRVSVIDQQERLIGDDTVAYVMDERRSIDIDTELDLEVAQVLFQRTKTENERGAAVDA